MYLHHLLAIILKLDDPENEFGRKNIIWQKRFCVIGVKVKISLFKVYFKVL